MHLLLLRLLSLAGAAAATLDATISNHREHEVKNVAIIGAGAAGSSAAYHLQKYAEEEGIIVNITVFEKTERIGGRTLTVNAYNDPEERVELGASIFITDNHILYNATKNFNLPIADTSNSDPSGYTAIWDGESIVYRSEKGSSYLWDAAKLLLKYGLSPYRAVQLVKNAVGTFLQLYEEPYFPFRSLTQRAFELGLLRLTGVTGEQYLKENNINPNFVRHLMQPATRVNYAANMAHIHGLEAMVSFATEGAVAVSGGNWQIFEKLLHHSNAAFYPNTTVTVIGLQRGSHKLGCSPKYTLFTKSSGLEGKSATKMQTTFDNIIIASPWQYSDIQAADGILRQEIETIPYMKLHVTLFTSPFKLQPSLFNLKPGSEPPSSVYTTLGKDEQAEEGPDGVGRTGFFSISTLRTVTNPHTQNKEFLYKIFSAEAVNATFLSTLLGVEVPATLVAGESSAGVPPISWYYPHWFYSYPIELPRVTFQDPVVGRGLYYTSGMESFISTMETSALMGMNVARLIADDFAGVNRNSRGGRIVNVPAMSTRGLKEDIWDSMDHDIGAAMDVLGADEL